MGKIKIDTVKVLSFVVSGLAIVGTLLSNVVQDKERENMKTELKKELLDEIRN